MKRIALAATIALCTLYGCFSEDNFDPAFGPDPGSCALTLICEPEMEEIRICGPESRCVPPFSGDGTQPPPPPQNSGESVVDLQGQDAPIIRLTSQYLNDLLQSSSTANFQDYSLISIYALKIVIDGTPTNDEPGAQRVFSVDPQIANIVDINAQEIWIRHGTVFQSARPGEDVVLRLNATEAIYVDKDVQTDGPGACPCISVRDESRDIKSVDSSITTGHNCVNAPTCAQLE